MSTKLSNTDRYPVPPDKLIEMMQGRKYFEAKYQALGDLKFEITKFEPSGDGLVLQVDREVASDMPDVAKKVLGETNHLIQNESWTKGGDGYSCDMSIDSPGKPISMKGSMSIVPVGDGESDWSLNLEIHAGVPFVGHKIEKMAEEQTRASVGREYEFIKGWLAGH